MASSEGVGVVEGPSGKYHRFCTCILLPHT